MRWFPGRRKKRYMAHRDQKLPISRLTNLTVDLVTEQLATRTPCIPPTVAFRPNAVVSILPLGHMRIPAGFMTGSRAGIVAIAVACAKRIVHRRVKAGWPTGPVAVSPQPAPAGDPATGNLLGYTVAQPLFRCLF